jgi:choline kinase
VHIVILAAGKGTRLGKPFPKSLTPVGDGTTILERQLRAFRSVFPEASITIAVGHQVEDIVDAYPDIRKHYNADFASTNTAKTLLGAMHGTPFDEGVLWVNGDLVFDEGVLRAFQPIVVTGRNGVAVDRSRVADEEVKYTLDEYGHIDRISKDISPTVALGEAVGINYISADDKGEFLYWLNAVREQDYFERAIELSASASRIAFEPVDITPYTAIEVDFAEDLARVEAALAEESKAA